MKTLDRGDMVHLDFNPQIGTEQIGETCDRIIPWKFQSKNRLYIYLSNYPYNKIMLALNKQRTNAMNIKKDKS